MCLHRGGVHSANMYLPGYVFLVTAVTRSEWTPCRLRRTTSKYATHRHTKSYRILDRHPRQPNIGKSTAADYGYQCAERHVHVQFTMFTQQSSFR